MTNTQTPPQVPPLPPSVYEKVLTELLADNDPDAYDKAAQAYWESLGNSPLIPPKTEE